MTASCSLQSLCPGHSVDLQLFVSERPSQTRWCGPWEPEPSGTWWSVWTERGNLTVSSARRPKAGGSIACAYLPVPQRAARGGEDRQEHGLFQRGGEVRDRRAGGDQQPGR